MAIADRTVGDQESVPAACMTAAIAKLPARLTMSVPNGKAVPNRCAVHKAIKYRVPVPTAPDRQIQMNRSMSRHLWVPRHEERTLPRLPAGVIGRNGGGGYGGPHRQDVHAV